MTATSTASPSPEAHAVPDHTNPVTIAHYELAGELGRGGMGAVYLARDIREFHLHDWVALKVVRRELADGECGQVQLARLLKEARTAGQLNHPNVARVLDAELLPDGSVYVAMELVRGATMQLLLRELWGTREKPFDVQLQRKLIAGLAQTLRGLHHAHERGVVHRDVKPANIILSDDGTAKVLDFGAAKKQGDTAADLDPSFGEGRVKQLLSLTETHDGMVSGTPLYMSPEQVRLTPVDGRSDVYCAGTVLFQILAGVTPFGNTRHRSPLSVMFEIDQLDPPLPTRIVCDVDPVFEAICLKALAKDAGLRFATALEMADAIDARLAESAVAPKLGWWERGRALLCSLFA